MVLNVFFFSDESMHNIYKNEGKYIFIEQLFQTIISALVSQLLQTLLDILSLSDVHYYQIKKLNKNEIHKEKILSILFHIKLKSIIFYIITFLSFLFYWYLITSFCAVYSNTQRIFITNSLTSFFLGLIEPFIVYFIPAGLRLLSLMAKEKNNLKIIYLLSNIIPFF